MGERSRLDCGVELKVCMYLNICIYFLSFMQNALLFLVHFLVHYGPQTPVLLPFQDTLMMGADYYQTESEIASLLAEGKVPIGIGENTKIR